MTLIAGLIVALVIAGCYAHWYHHTQADKAADAGMRESQYLSVLQALGEIHQAISAIDIPPVDLAPLAYTQELSAALLTRMDTIDTNMDTLVTRVDTTDHDRRSAENEAVITALDGLREAVLAIEPPTLDLSPFAFTDEIIETLYRRLDEVNEGIAVLTTRVETGPGKRTLRVP